MNSDRELANASTNPAPADPDLYPWDFGSAVAQLQELLRAHGFDVKLDGDFGSRTEAAVKAYQKQQGLKINGVVDSKTWTALKTTIQPGTRLLRRGHTGADVRELQGLLQIQGYNVPRTGIFCVNTKQAVIAFQQRHHLKDNGMVDCITWTILRGGLPLPTCPKQTGWFFNIRKWW